MVIDLSTGLQELGMAVTVGHFGNPWLAERCGQRGLPQLVVGNHAAFKSTASLPRFAWSFAAQIKREGFHAVHAHLYGATVAAAMAGPLAHLPVVGTLHDAYTLTERPARIRLLQLAAFAGAPLVSVAHYMQALFCGMAWFPSGAWRTIHNGIDTDRFAPLPTAAPDTAHRAGQRRALGLPAQGVLIGSVGRLVPLKRFDALIRAFVVANVPARLVIIGDGPERDTLQSLVAQLGAGEQVKLLGQRGDVADLLPLFDIFTLWSETEGLSCSIAEAMACGLPCVVSDVGGNSELVTQGETGYLVPPQDTAELASRLTALCQDVAQRWRLAKAARSTIEHQFSLAAMTKAYARMLDPANTHGQNVPGQMEST